MKQASSFKRFLRAASATLLLFGLGLAPADALASSAPPPEEVQKAITAFFNLLKQDKLDEAYDIILANTKIKGREEDVKGLKKQTREAITTYGPTMGFEVVETRRVGMSLLQVVCLSWSDNFPLRWRFTYYRPGDRWRLLDIFVDDKVGELFDPRPTKVPPADQKGAAP